MAMSFVSAQRRKVTYGKAARNPSYSLFADDSPAQPKSEPPARRRIREVRTEEVSVQPSPNRATTGKLVAPSLKAAGGQFDVPSSDDEGDPFKLTGAKPSRHFKAGRKTGGPKIEATGKELRHKKDDPNTGLDRWRKRKREAVDKEASHKTEKEDEEHPKTVGLTRRIFKEVAIAPSPEKARLATAQHSDRKQAKRARPNERPKHMLRPVEKSTSAPAALLRMDEPKTLVDTSDAPIPDARGTESSPVIDQTVAILPNTPPLAPLHSPQSIPGSGAVTPRQKDIWKKLLHTSDSVESPSGLPIAKLDLSKGMATTRMAAFTRSASDMPQTRRSRLVDTLKLSASTDEESDSDEDVPELELSSDTIDSRPIVLQPANSSEPGSQEAQGFTRPSKATYALESRTYLQDRDEDETFDLLSAELNETAGFSSHSQPQDHEELEDDDDSQSRQPRSVHDLRAAGARRRLLDGLDSLVEEVSGQGFNSLSAKRSALIELATKLFQKDAALCALDYGLERKLLNYASSISDPVFNFAAAVALSLLADEGARSTTLRHIYNSDCFKHVLELLPLTHDISRIIKERKINMSKIAQSSVLEFKKQITESDLWPAQPASVSPQLVALKALDTLVRRTREMGDQDVLIDEGLVGTLLGVLRTHLQVSEDASQDWSIIPGLVLSVLMSSSLFDLSYRKRSGWSAKHLTTLSHLMPSLLTQTHPGTEEFQPLALKLCINVTNQSPRACETFSSPTLIQPLLRFINDRFSMAESFLEGDDRNIILDRLILSLGALLNLAEFSSDARHSATEGDAVNLNEAVQHFLYGQERAQEADSLQAAEMNIPYGWLAVVLGNLCQDYDVRERIRDEMPDKSLRKLISAVDVFSKIFQRMNLQELEGDGGQAVANDFVERMRAVVDRLREVEGV